MRIITVNGKSSSGKSSAIKYALVKLLERYDFKVFYISRKYVCYSGNKELLEKILINFKTTKGYVSQLTCVGILDGKKICITTYGDSFKYDISPALKKGEQMLGKLDIFVCGSHGNGFDELKKISGGNIIVKEKQRNEKNKEEKANREFGDMLVQEIFSVLNEKAK